MLKVGSLRYVGGTRPILDGVDLAVEAGEVRLLVGASGAGKTTLLRLIAGLEAPDAGSIEIDGSLVSAKGEVLVAPHRRGVAMAFQDGALWPHMTVERHLRFGLASRMPDRSERDRHVDALLDLVNLRERRAERPGHLSGGERQRVGLARALALRPRLLLLDEPLAHVDLAAQARLARDLLGWIRDHDTTALWVTHRPGEVAFVHESVSVIARGRIVEDVPADNVAAWLRRLGAASPSDPK